MNITGINSINFSGIKLPSSKFEYSREVRDMLVQRGVDVVGYKTCYIDNNFLSKQKLIQKIRKRYNFAPKECGVIFFPWSKESWLLANPKFEQELYNMLKEANIKATINIAF